MHSNVITPPDFVNDKLHTVTVVDASVEDVELLARMCEVSDEMYNIYLYRTEMDDTEWLNSAVDRSDAVIVNSDVLDNINLRGKEKTYYYGDKTFLVPATKINNPLEYFAFRQQSNK